MTDYQIKIQECDNGSLLLDIMNENKISDIPKNFYLASIIKKLLTNKKSV